MPTYDFRCADCGKKFTVRVSIKDRDKVTCTYCASKKVDQLFTGCSVRTGGCELPVTGGGFPSGGG